MIIPRREDVTGVQGIEKASVQDTKKAVVFATLGVPLDFATGIFITKKPGQEWLDGVANFPFVLKHQKFYELSRIYDGGTADAELDAALDELKASADPKVAETAARIEKLLINGLFVWGRRFLENYSRMLAFISTKAAQIELVEKSAGAFQFKFFGRNHK